ncbi:cytidylyltransferase family protein [Plectosphaerella plurivora]|uniref:Cytidylyltransferase family protein n=1 Tax=Plectosphaerella plurivora TaxID=936078 RepID=A0A9P8VK64_9PEZI|nr:cytidylyltransferase family protein [Plectosphaerella plurivora]
MSTRQTFLKRFADQLAAFQAGTDAFTVFSQVAASSASAGPPKPRPGTLVVLDSSFNPPTRAHLRMATSAIRSAAQARDRTPADVRLLLLLAVNNADKAPKPAAFHLRMEMMRLFALDLLDHPAGDEAESKTQGTPTLGEAGLAVDLGLTTLPYFHDKSRAIAESGAYEGSEQVVLAGYDTLIRIFNPKYYEGRLMSALDPFFARARLRITTRTGDGWGGRQEQVEYLQSLRAGKLADAGGREEWCDRVDLVEGGSEVVSSTKVREAAERSDAGALGALVTKRVGEFVLEEKLYRTAA